MISLNTSSDESMDDEDYHPVIHPCCRNDLYIARTKLCSATGRRLPFLGVFTSKPLKVGDFVGFYTGEWWDPKAYKKLEDRDQRDEYAFGTSDGVIISPPIRTNGRPAPTSCPMAMCNEPIEHSVANAMIMEYKFLLDEINIDPDLVDDERHDNEFTAAGVVMCRPIGANKEILWYYGKNFHRGYDAGKNCKSPHKKKLQDPLEVLGRIPRCAVPITIRKIPERSKKSRKRSRT